MPFFLSFLLQLVLLALLLAGAWFVLGLAWQREPATAKSAPSAPALAVVERIAWVITVESSLLAQPQRVEASTADELIEFGGAGYVIPSRALAGVNLRFRHDPERNGLSLETSSTGIRIGTTEIEKFSHPYVVDRDEITFTADASVKMVFARVDAT